MVSGAQTTTLDRSHGGESVTSILWKSAQWGGLMFAVACGGAAAYVRSERMNEVPGTLIIGTNRAWRLAFSLLMCGTALLAPLGQAYQHTSVSLFKHIGFGLLFAAPLAGVGIVRVVGAHFRQPQLGILIWVVMLALGISQSTWRFATWPDSTQLTAVLTKHVDHHGRYLSEPANVPAYYLDTTAPEQWSNTYGIGYRDPHGVMHHGDDGFRLAVEAGRYDVVVLDGITTPGTDKLIAAALRTNGHYRLLARLPFTTVAGPGVYQVYVKR